MDEDKNQELPELDVEQKSTTYIVKSMKTSKHMESQHTDILQRLKIS